MCILTYLTPGAAPDLDALLGGALANPHGHGYAVIAGHRILVGHGLDPRAMISEFAAVRAEHPEGAALFHSRLATHGTIDPANTHPFLVGGDERTVIAHNGILPDSMHPVPGDLRSDTRIAAEEFLPRQPFGSLDSDTGRGLLERWLGTDKMVLLTVDPAYQQSAYLFNERSGYWSDAGIWYSNLSYRTPPVLYGSDYSIEDEVYCLDCGEYDPERPGAHCTYCGFCAECLRTFPHCECRDVRGRDRYADLDEHLTA
ncbi:hypothetical protein K7711_44275 [Nocardia sp. CA2R105]|uniref:hypothetical protein n=1 Tax=Nocardia coffeae TaxID=2873381 RepID=UPI001CA75858|nr:hypothetical protein [Nocardia coffeae]MBY8863550.1 hypothetical protein [Nocardia coffeae]